jgi:hypothetical protein
MKYPGKEFLDSVGWNGIEASSYLPLSSDDKKILVNHFSNLMNLSSIDREILNHLITCLHSKVESVKILNYLIYRLSPDIKNAEMNLIQKKNFFLETISSNDEDYFAERIANNKICDEINEKLKYYSNSFMAEQRGHWLKKQYQLRQERNKYKSLFNQINNMILLNKPKITAFKHMKQILLNIQSKCIKIAKFIFSRKYAYSKKKMANILLRKMDGALKVCDLNINDYPISDQEEILIQENLIQNGLQNAFKAMEIISSNPVAKRIYESLELDQKEDAIRIIVEGTQKLKEEKEIENKILENIQNSIKMLSTEQSSKEIDDEEDEKDENDAENCNMQLNDRNDEKANETSLKRKFRKRKRQRYVKMEKGEN